LYSFIYFFRELVVCLCRIAFRKKEKTGVTNRFKSSCPRAVELSGAGTCPHSIYDAVTLFPHVPISFKLIATKNGWRRLNKFKNNWIASVLYVAQHPYLFFFKTMKSGKNVGPQSRHPPHCQKLSQTNNHSLHRLHQNDGAKTYLLVFFSKFNPVNKIKPSE